MNNHLLKHGILYLPLLLLDLEILGEKHIRHNARNFFKYFCTHFFVVNMCASGLFIANVDGLALNSTLLDHLPKLLPDSIQV